MNKIILACCISCIAFTLSARRGGSVRMPVNRRPSSYRPAPRPAVRPRPLPPPGGRRPVPPPGRRPKPPPPPYHPRPHRPPPPPPPWILPAAIYIYPGGTVYSDVTIGTPSYTYRLYNGLWVPYYKGWYYYQGKWCWGGEMKPIDLPPSWKPF